MFAFLIGMLLALLGTFSLFIMNVIGLLLKLDRISITPIRYFCSITLVILHVILTIFGVWLLLNVLSTYCNINTSQMQSWHVVVGIIVGFVPAIFVLNKSVNKFRNYIALKNTK